MELKKKVLIVEDDPLQHESLTLKFNKEGFEVLHAHDGLEGLNLALKNKPDVIILDLMMEKMGGFDLLERLRKDEWGKDAHVIILTNLAEERFIDQAKHYNVDYSFLKTNLTLEQITSKVKEICG